MNKTMTALLALAMVIAATVTRGSAQAAGSGEEKGSTTQRNGRALPSCTQPISGIGVPNAPHGLFVPLFPNSRMNAEANRYLLHNPVVCGANFYVVWSQSDKGPGANPRYDFNYVDDQMAPWIAAGKPVNLIVWATSYTAKERDTPDYVLSKAPTVECSKFGRVPIFWNKAFVDNYQAFMSAVVQRYGNNAAIGYIRFGIGAGGETFPACMFELRRHGMSDRVWREYVLDMLDYEKSLNSPKLLMVGVNAYGNPADVSLPQAIAARAAENGIAIGSQGLQTADLQADASGSPCTVDWCRIFRQYRGKVPLELQSVGPSHPDGSGPGSLVDLLPFGLRNHAQIFEILLPDWLIAYDPNFPGFNEHHVAYQHAFEAAANVLGGH
jgi:hypothetical protein